VDEAVAVPVEVPIAPASDMAAVVAAGLSVIIEREPVAVAFMAAASVETAVFIELVMVELPAAAALTSMSMVTPWPAQRAVAIWIASVMLLVVVVLQDWSKITGRAYWSWHSGREIGCSAGGLLTLHVGVGAGARDAGLCCLHE